MKNFLIAALAMFASSAAVAQVSYGIKTGVNLTKTNYEDFSSDFKQKNYLSYFITGYAEFGLGGNFGLQPGVSLQGKGDKYTKDGETVATWDVMSIEVPVNLMYYIPTGESGSVFIGAGPYVGFNIAGKTKVEAIGAPDFGTVGESDLKFSGDDRDQKLIDAGANFLLGYKLRNGFLINAEYGLGIADLHPREKNDHLHNYTIRFGIGYQF
ncbi:porin family protein [Sphingobacterium bovistauri]|uniref:PorT family protein n=1 Tax=Sphingobacterium bovistauri TaxID=2781959 RepID=A0ABS7Z2R5_9SPHI|nr:porin family protein [Sphingobacterium bovistauri]MCA5004470.1 PorT family protein [Sphingobacterium bovistauri]